MMEIKNIINIEEALVKLWEYDIDHQKINFPKDSPNYDEFKKNTLKEYQEQPEGFFFVYEDGRIIGFLKLRIRYNPFRKQTHGWLGCIHLEPESRSKGYGKQLMKFVDEYFRKRVCAYSFLGTSFFNEASRGLFRKSGYSEVRVIMEKEY